MDGLESSGIEPSAIDSNSDNRAGGHMSIEGWPDLGRVVSDLPHPDTQHPRGSFTAKRGGKHSYGHTYLKSGSGSNEDGENAVAEELGDSENSVHPSRQRRIYTSPSPEEDEIHVAMPNPTPNRNNTRLEDIQVPEPATLGMIHLLTLPAKRTVEWRPEATKSLNLKAQIESAMGYCVGEPPAAPCTRCAKGIGAFDKCITVYGNFQQACVSCNYTSTATACNFHVPQSTRHGVVLEVSPNRPPPKKRVRTKKSTSFQPNLSPASHMKQQMQPPVDGGRILTLPQQPVPEAPHRAYPSTISPPPPPPTPHVEPVNRSSRYLAALVNAQAMSQEELELELADLKFQAWVISNTIANRTPPSTTFRYKQAQLDFRAMSREEQELELAGFRFRLSVLQDVVRAKNA